MITDEESDKHRRAVLGYLPCAAASEMKERVRAALEEAIEKILTMKILLNSFHLFIMRIYLI